MDNAVINTQLAARLVAVRTNQKPLAPLRDMHSDPSVDNAYEIQSINHANDVLQGRVPVGTKIGLTSLAVQKQLGVDEPDFGRLYSDMEYRDGAQAPLSKYIQPKIEAEIAFRLSKTIDREITDSNQLVDYIDYACAALEIVDSRIENWNIRIFDTISDNASSASYVLSAIHKNLSEFDLVNCQMKMLVDGETVSQGSGAACLGHPLNAVMWLSNKMLSLGEPLCAGSIVLSGALGPMVAVSKPMSVT